MWRSRAKQAQTARGAGYTPTRVARLALTGLAGVAGATWAGRKAARRRGSRNGR